MVKTWVAVNSVECGRNVAVPMKFLFSFQRFQAYNRRVNRNQVYLVFYSPNHNQTANFHLAKRATFSATDDAFYYAKILACFGE